MQALPKLTIVTPSFNSQHTIRETLQSVRDQKYPNLEHLVIDGGSKDSTLDIVKDFPEIKWVSEKDKGHYDAMNKGIRMATGEVVAILNSDDCYREGALLKVGEAFAANPNWDAGFGDVVFVDGKGVEIYRREEAIWDFGVLLHGLGYVIHPTLFVKKSLYDRLGGYRHQDYMNCCDYEFLLRMGASQCRVGHIPALLVNYRFHEFGQSADLRVQRNNAIENQRIREAYGAPPGMTGRLLNIYARGKRQFQKLYYRGKVDLVPGTWKLRPHFREKTEFSSNCGVDKLEIK